MGHLTSAMTSSKIFFLVFENNNVELYKYPPGTSLVSTGTSSMPWSKKKGVKKHSWKKKFSKKTHFKARRKSYKAKRKPTWKAKKSVVRPRKLKLGAPDPGAVFALKASEPDEGYQGALASAVSTGGTLEQGCVGRCPNNAIPLFTRYFCKMHFEEEFTLSQYDGSGATIRQYQSDLRQPQVAGSLNILSYWDTMRSMYYDFKVHAVHITIVFGYTSATPANPARCGVFGTILPPAQWTDGPGAYLPPATAVGWDQSQIPHKTSTVGSHDAGRSYAIFSAMFRLKDMFAVPDLSDDGFTGATGADGQTPASPTLKGYFGVWAEPLIGSSLDSFNVKVKLTYLSEFYTPVAGLPASATPLEEEDFDFDKMDIVTGPAKPAPPPSYEGGGEAPPSPPSQCYDC